MQIYNTNNTCNFKALNLKKVDYYHKDVVMKDLDYLKSLGKQYDVKLKSTTGMYGIPFLNIYIRPLGNNMNIIQKLFRNTEKIIFGLEDTSIKSLIEGRLKHKQDIKDFKDFKKKMIDLSL